MMVGIGFGCCYSLGLCIHKAHQDAASFTTACTWMSDSLLVHGLGCTMEKVKWPCVCMVQTVSDSDKWLLQGVSFGLKCPKLGLFVFAAL